MQEQPLQPRLLAQPLVDRRIAIFVVARHGVADVLGMDADLVGTAGRNAHLAIGLPAPALQYLEVAQRGFAGGMHLHMPLAALAQTDKQRRVDRHHPVGHAPGQQRQVTLGDATVLAHQRLHFSQRRTFLGDDQQARSVAVQPVHQFQRVPGPRGAQGLDRAKGNAAAAMAGHAGGLVQGQQPCVLEHDRRIQRIHEALRGRGLLADLAESDRGDPDLIADLELAFGFRPATVDPHLPGAHQLVDQRPRCAFEQPKQEIVQPLAFTVIGHANGTGASADAGGFWLGHAGRVICYTRDAR